MKLACNWMCEFKKSLPDDINIIFQYESQFWNEEVGRNIDEAEEEHGVNLNIMKIDTPHANKLGRIIKLPYFHNSRIYYNIELKSHNDTQVGVMQLCAIEEGSGEHDDSPDADQQAIAHLEKYTTSSKQQNQSEKSYQVGRMKRKDYII